MSHHHAFDLIGVPAAARVATVAACFTLALTAPACSDTGAGGHVASDGRALSGDCPTEVTPEDGLVITAYGPVRGQREGDTYAYKGIPYAAPPVGDLRFRPPQPPACIEGELDATSFRPACPQPGLAGGVIGDEDCLTLNVWTPVEPPSSPRTVMVWIHGGNNRVNSSGTEFGGDLLFDGRPYVEQADVVFVSFDYRLGALGFMALPELSAEDANGSSGNYGLLDQIAALEWVRDNIAQFGGDPQRVMVFGQSAGAMDICALMTSPLASGLFHRALMSSGACTARPLSLRQAYGTVWADSMGCRGSDVVSCLRGLNPATIVRAQPGPVINPMGMTGQPFMPAIDGYVLPEDPLQAIEGGHHDDLPFVIGSTSYEASLAVQPVVTNQQFYDFVDDHFGAGADQVLQLYHPQIQGNARKALIALSTDSTWTCPARRAAQAMAASQTSPVYRYFFAHAMDQLPIQALGAFHALDVYFTFQHDAVTFEYQNVTFSQQLTPREQSLSHNMLGYWSRFASTGDPNGGGPVVWSPSTPGADLHVRLDTPIETGSSVRPVRCDLLDSL